MRKWRAILGAAVVVAAVATVVGTQTGSSGPARSAFLRGVPALTGAGGAGPSALARTSAALAGTGFISFDGISPAVRTLPNAPTGTGPIQAHEVESLLRATPVAVADPVVQTDAGDGPAPAPSPVFDGICLASCPQGGSGCQCLPPDTVGEVGSTQFVQGVNNSFAVYNKTTGAVLKAATVFHTLWSTGLCAEDGNSDPIVLYDQLANRWVLSEVEAIALGASGNGECIAVSTSDDATGTYYLYSINTGTTFHDYPKLSVWPNAYFMTSNEFPENAQLSQGVGAFAFERDKMLLGQPARYVYYDEGAKSTQATFFAGQLPVDLDGAGPVPASAPGMVVGVDDPASYPPGGNGFNLRVWKFAVDWSPAPPNPPISSFGVGSTPPTPTQAGIGGDPNFTVPVSPFARTQCVYGHPPASCVPQAGPTQTGPAPEGLDVLGDRLMNRAAYRTFAGHDSLMLNLSVVAPPAPGDPNSQPRIGIRWMEVRNPSGIGGSPTIHQEGTYSPDDTPTNPLWRWIGSIAQDSIGDIALGFSASGPRNFPDIRYTGRLVTDGPPLGEMTVTETVLPVGLGGAAYAGPQTQIQGRWGDYSDLTIDPVDDCTFYYTQEYLGTSGVVLGTWRTKVGAFKFPACGKTTVVGIARFTARWNRGGVSVAWRTAAETRTAGFNVWRSTGKGWRKVNAALVAAKVSGSARGASYRLVDRTVRKGRFYTYRLQVVDLKGARTWFGVGAVPVR